MDLCIDPHCVDFYRANSVKGDRAVRIPIDRESETPLYDQIQSHLRRGVLTGALPAGAKLPAARALAAALGVGRITVETAYANLEAEGLVRRRSGSGTYVLPPGPAPRPRVQERQWPRWQMEAAARARFVSPDPNVALAGEVGRKDRIAFTGFGDPRQFRVDEFYRAIREVIRRDGAAAFDVRDAMGFKPLRETIAQILSSQGVQADPESVLITSGSQQGLALAAQLLLCPGDSVIVERPTYDGALDLFRAHGVEVIGCETDARGMRVEALESLILRHRPKLIYTIPNFQNPTGASMSTPRRRRLAAVAERHGTPIFEDDFAGDLRFEGTAQPALKSLDSGGWVIYAGTFSKLLMPGIRLGYLVADGPVLELLAHSKRIHDLTTSTLMQRALEQYVTVGRYHAHLRRAAQAYRRRRDTLLDALERFLPGVLQTPVVPQGGLFLWARLPEGLKASELLRAAAEEEVAFAAGPRFFPDPNEGEGYIRLNFASRAPEEIDEGVRRLARALRRLVD